MVFEDHVFDLFGDGFEDWMEKNNVLPDIFISWSELEILPDDHPDHEKSLEAYLEDDVPALPLIFPNGHRITITLEGHPRIVEISVDFPEEMLTELKELARNGPQKSVLKEL